MANYNVDIAVALKGAEKLNKFNKQIKDVSNNIKSANTFLESFSKTARLASGAFDGANGLVRNVDNLQKNLGLAKTNLKSVALGTKEATIAAYQFVKAREQLNKGLQEELALINKVEEARRFTRMAKAGIRPGTMYAGPIGPGQATSMFGGRVRQNIAASQAIRGMSGFAAFSGGATQVSQNAKTEAIQAKARAKHLKNIDKKVAKIATIQTQQQAQRGFAGLPQPFGVTGGQIGPALPRGFRFRQQFQQGGMFGMPGGAMGRLRGGAGSAMIGGGFPLLFGAGGLSSVMGGVAGGIGGALAPGGGFAASIAATAIAAQVQEVRKFRKAVRELNRDLEASGAATNVSRKEIKELAKSLNITKEEAIDTLLQFRKFADSGFVNLSKIFGNREMFDATIGLNDFASTLQRIETLSEKLTLETEFQAYKILFEEGNKAANQFIRNQFLIRQQYDSFATTFENDRRNFQKLGVSCFSADMGFSNNAGILGRGFFQDSYNKDFSKILDYYIQNNKEIQEILTDPTSYKNNDLDNILSRDSINKIDDILKPFLKDSEKVKKFLQELPEEFGYSTKSAEELVETMSKLVEEKQFLEEFRAPDEELRKLLNPLRQILDLSTEIKLGFEDAFKGVIKGTMSVSDAFRNMLNRIADYFLDTAARLLALQAQRGFLSLFSNMFDFKAPTDSTSNDLNLADMEKYSRAGGGPVKGGTGYLVGERGPEIFTPGVSGMITPNHALGGSTNIVVNVDASGSSVEGDEQSGRELGRMISVAIQSELIKQKRPGGLLV